MIPALTLIFKMEQVNAQNINLICFVPMGIIAIVTHAKNGNIEKKVVWKLVLCGVVGAVAGAAIAVRMDGDVLRKVFGCFLMLMGVSEFFKKETRA